MVTIGRSRWRKSASTAGINVLMKCVTNGLRTTTALILVLGFTNDMLTSMVGTYTSFRPDHVLADQVAGLRDQDQNVLRRVCCTHLPFSLPADIFFDVHMHT